MNTKLTVTLALATSMLGGAAHAFDLDGEVSFDDKLAIDDASSSIDMMWSNKDGQQASDALFGSAILTADPSPVCANVTASKSFYKPLRSESLAGQTVSVGLQGEARLIADTTQLGVQVAFGPAVEFLGNVHRTMDVRLTASTKPGGLNSLDLGFFAFGYEIDSYNLANTSNPIQHIASHNWSLPYVPRSTFWNGSIGCGFIPATRNCSISWNVGYAAVANLSAILVLKVNSNGVDAHAMTSANSYFNLTPTGMLSVEVYDPTEDDWFPLTATASGTGAISLGRAYFAGHGVLKPQDSRWSAKLDVGYNIEDLLSAKASIAASFLTRTVRKTLFEKTGQTFADAYLYECLFDKRF